MARYIPVWQHLETNVVYGYLYKYLFYPKKYLIHGYDTKDEFR